MYFKQDTIRLRKKVRAKRCASESKWVQNINYVVMWLFLCFGLFQEHMQ